MYPVLSPFFRACSRYALTGLLVLQQLSAAGEGLWSQEQANSWYARQPWLVGSNYIPSNAINQLEMWQADTFDPRRIDEELGWAEGLGFNSMRVFLHHMAYQQDPEGFLNRVEEYLKIADKHRIGTMFVLFDSVWDPNPRPGKQREPRKGVHNSGWLQTPGNDVLKDPGRHDEMKSYVQAVVKRFGNDRRVQVWDIWNEPDQMNGCCYKDLELPNKAELVLELMEKAFVWARETSPTQPLTTGLWAGNWAEPEKLSPLHKFQLEQSDVISFHTYAGADELTSRIQQLKRYNRPLLCTEYMARPYSTFDPALGILKQHQVGAYNWGFAEGKTNTIYPWDSWQKPYDKEPDPWFSDILRRDGKPYRPEEVDYIRKMTGAAARKPGHP